MPKLVLYKGACKSIVEGGKKFTDRIKTHIVDDELAVQFQNLNDFDVLDIQGNDAIKPKEEKKDEDPKDDKKDEDPKDDKKDEDPGNEENQTPGNEESHEDLAQQLKSKFSKLGVDSLRDMCKEKELSIDGKKEELIARLVEAHLQANK